MKPVSHFIIFTLAILTSMASAQAQSSREQLSQMVEQLQKTPTDNALREKIIKLAQTVKPAPAIPDEVQRRMARGRAAFMGAKSAADYQDAVKEFEQATMAAPWYGDAYYNLGVAQDKAKQHESALRSLKLAQLTSPDSKEIKDLIYQVEYRNEKASTRASAPAPGPTGPDFSGGWDQLITGRLYTVFFIEKNGDNWIVRGPSRVPLRVVKAQGRQLWIEGSLVPHATTHYEFVLSEDGQTIDVATKLTQSAEQFAQMERTDPGARYTALDVYGRYVVRRNPK